MATAMKRNAKRAAEKGGQFRLLVGAHVGPGPKGCECDDCLKSKGANHVYNAKRYDGRNRPLDPDGYDNDTIDSPDVDLVARFNTDFSVKFERVGPGQSQTAAAPAPFPLEKMTLAQLMAVANEEEIDLKGASKKEDIIRIIKGAEG
jgi:hypothetical protein